MKAWVTYDFNDMRLEDVEMPKVKPGWALIKVKVVQPSITDVRLFSGENLTYVEVMKQKLEKEAPVQLLGHEFCGRVIDVGTGVNRIKIGDMVAAHSVAPCRECKYCRMGLTKYCENPICIGMQTPGAFAEYIIVPEDVLVSVPSNISPSEAACIQPLSECITEVYNSDINPGDSIAIIGQGAMGLFSLAAARYGGAGKIITADIRDEALKVSKNFGANYVINLKESDLVKSVSEQTDGLGVDIVFECSSVYDNIKKALEMVKWNGKIVCLSIIGGEVPISLAAFRKKCVNLIFPGLTTFKMLEHTVFMLSSGLIDLKPLITHKLKGIDKVPESFEITGNKAKYKATLSAQVIVDEDC